MARDTNCTSMLVAPRGEGFFAGALSQPFFPSRRNPRVAMQKWHPAQYTVIVPYMCICVHVYIFGRSENRLSSSPWMQCLSAQGVHLLAEIQKRRIKTGINKREKLTVVKHLFC